MKKNTIFVILILANVYAWSYIASERGRNLLTVIFLDIGQGDSIYIEAPNGNNILIDSGANEIVIRKLSEFLPYSTRTISGHIITHPDLDHIGGSPSILSRYNVGEYFAYDKIATSSLTEKINEIVEANKTASSSLEAGDKIILDRAHNIYIEILWPTDLYTSEDKNNLSITTRLVYGQTSFIMTGDAPIQVENFLGKEYLDLHANILKLGHHGSKNSTATGFLKKVNPDYVVVSASADNKYNHPHPDIIQKVENFFAEKNINGSDRILKTTDGSVVLKSDGISVWPAIK